MKPEFSTQEYQQYLGLKEQINSCSMQIQSYSTYMQGYLQGLQQSANRLEVSLFGTMSNQSTNFTSLNPTSFSASSPFGDNHLKNLIPPVNTQSPQTSHIKNMQKFCQEQIEVLNQIKQDREKEPPKKKKRVSIEKPANPRRNKRFREDQKEKTLSTQSVVTSMNQSENSASSKSPVQVKTERKSRVKKEDTNTYMSPESEAPPKNFPKGDIRRITNEQARNSNSAPEIINKRGGRKKKETEEYKEYSKSQEESSESSESDIEMIGLDDKNHDDPESNRKLKQIKQNFMSTNRQNRLKNRIQVSQSSSI